MHEAIKKIEVKNNILSVQAHMPLRKYCRDTKEFLNTKKVIDLLKEKYKILETIKEDKISNWDKSGYNREGLWEFKIQSPKKPPRKQKKEVVTPPEPKPQQPEPIQEIEKAPPQAQQPKRKPAPRKQSTGTKRSIRGRMSKIAKDKIGE